MTNRKATKIAGNVSRKVLRKGLLRVWGTNEGSVRDGDNEV